MIQVIIKNIIFLALGILGIGILIGFHELGHFLFAKLFKISTPSFSIGMGPKLLKKKIGDTMFSISALPLGGYVEIAGMAEVGQGDQKESKRTDEFSFSSKPYYQKLLVLSGGILFNLIMAYFLLSLLFMTGFPKMPMLFPADVKPVIAKIEPGSAAEKFNLQIKDKILAINNEPVNNIVEFTPKLKSFPNQQIKLLIEREGKQIEVELTTDSKMEDSKPVGTIGIQYLQEVEGPKELPSYSIFESIKSGFKTTNELIYQSIYAFKFLLKKRSTDGLGGPIAVIGQTMKSAEQGIKIFLFFIAFISINLAVLNLIPLPILDGGQILFTTIEAIIRRNIPENIKLIIHYISWIFILLLTLYLTKEDIRRLLK